MFERNVNQGNDYRRKSPKPWGAITIVLIAIVLGGWLLLTP